ncbi:hypothetical protein D3C78_1704170 [compost metagenome]
MAQSSVTSTGNSTSRAPLIPRAARSSLPSASRPSCAISAPSTARGQSSNRVTAVIPMR